MSHLLSFSLGSALVVAATVAFAADTELAAQVAACARERDDAARLACFDRLTRKPEAAASGAPAAKATEPVKTPTAAQAPAAPAAAATAGAAGAATAAATTTAPAAKSAVDDFGVWGSESARQREAEAQKQPGAPAKIDKITAAVTAISKRPRGEMVVTLDNGQVWAQKDAQYLPIKVGDQVTILAAALHSYKLIVAGRVTSVTRVQ
jgi:hypothetical protein